MKKSNLLLWLFIPAITSINYEEEEGIESDMELTT